MCDFPVYIFMHRSICVYSVSVDSVCELLNFLYLSSQQPKLRVARVALYCGCVTLLRSFFSRQDLFFHSFSQHLKTTAQTRASVSQSTLNKVRAAQKNSLKHHIWSILEEKKRVVVLMKNDQEWTWLLMMLAEAEDSSSDCSSTSPTGTTSSLPALSGPLWVFWSNRIKLDQVGSNWIEFGSYFVDIFSLVVCFLVKTLYLSKYLLCKDCHDF